jgi:hypothetical protein
LGPGSANRLSVRIELRENFGLRWTRASRLHVLAAIDRDIGPRQKCGLLAREIGHEAGHFFGLAESSHENLGMIPNPAPLSAD